MQMFYFFNKIFVRGKWNFTVDADVKMSMHRFTNGLQNGSHKAISKGKWN